MASIKIELYKGKKLLRGLHPVVLRFTHAGKVKRISLGYKCLPDDWNPGSGRFKRSFADYRNKNEVLTSIEARALDIKDQFKRSGKSISISGFESKFRRGAKPVTIWKYAKEVESDLRQAGRIASADAMRATANQLKKYKSDPNLLFSDIDQPLLEGLESHLLSTTCTGGGVAFYMRTLRALVNRAIKNQILPVELYPFSTNFNSDGYSLSHLKSIRNPRSLSPVDMQKIKDFDHSKYPHLSQTVSYFLFSYYARGMNFTDMAKLLKGSISNGRISYNRSKTRGGEISIRISLPLEALISRLAPSKTAYIFPILSGDHKTPQQIKYRIQKCLKKYNKELKEVGRVLRIETKLTSYVARHTYADTLQQGGVRMELISQNLGHKELSTTRSYLNKFDFDEQDKADELL